MTTRELARLAGVSCATVSLALRNHPRISAPTRRRVLRLARQSRFVVDGRLSELMQRVRAQAEGQLTGCLGLISLQPAEKPWLDAREFPHLHFIHRGILKRAAQLGYRIEPFWVKNPAMSCRRLRAVLEARGIQGLLCLGSPELEEKLPADLGNFVIVTQGNSISSRVHRVLNHFARNTTILLEELQRRGYRRPGLVHQQVQDGRNGHLVAGLYLYFSRYVFGSPDVPILYAEGSLDPDQLTAWHRQHRPDVLIFTDHRHLPALQVFLGRERLCAPADFGLVAVDLAIHPPGMSGVLQNFQRLGSCAVDMLVGRLQQGESGPPAAVKVECVEGDWFEGETVRPPAA